MPIALPRAIWSFVFSYTWGLPVFELSKTCQLCRYVGVDYAYLKETVLRLFRSALQGVTAAARYNWSLDSRRIFRTAHPSFDDEGILAPAVELHNARLFSWHEGLEIQRVTRSYFGPISLYSDRPRVPAEIWAIIKEIRSRRIPVLF